MGERGSFIQVFVWETRAKKENTRETYAEME
jgi:hypothetical protein